ncbi:alkaline phosphatase D family protein [Haloarcula sp. S1CR25-12]|uniref:Alkaline phosphatase D family protein n=1 Tax=Haloarcula saliterrae TaxID=2950534 RepID=A0ABU2FAW6_9EURY|nr:alkaline phosphatase D family protein [Haloarcula sp. S1CR25-12]MDS0258861.1 alkaline phosphatase D family protein [Haloarcula sp. S1CR25-12]
MRPTDLPDIDTTAQDRRTFLQRTGGVSLAAILGASGGAAAMVDDDGNFESDPYTLGVASGDPLPDSVILWTRLAPNPLDAGGGMPDEEFDIEWTVATDEAMTDVVTSGTATAEPDHAHTVHVDADGLAPDSAYYYRFECRGETSPVGRTKTAPAAGASVEEFQFGFASCNRWVDGYYTAFEHMAEDELDLVVHLGDYIYEYGIDVSESPREQSLPQAYKQETTDLDTYRLRYGLYKSDPDMRAAHASAPWLVTRDDHEVDNNWAGDVPQDPDEQSTEAFIERRAAALKAYYEHMPFRMAQKPDDASQKLYRYYAFGDLLDFNVLDTRLYRSDQACDDVFDKVDCEERFEADRTILGDSQEQWLLDNLEATETTWNVLANQLPFAKMDFKAGEQEGFRTEQWDGYVPEQRLVKTAFEEDANNPVVITGDFHSHWANTLVSAKDGSSEPVGAEFVGTSISSGGNGTDMDEFGRQVVSENDNVEYYNNQRGYVRCTVTPETWTTEFRVLDYVDEPGSRIETDATVELTAGQPGIPAERPLVLADAVAVGNGKTATAELTGRWLDEGLSGGTISVSLADPEVATITGATVDDAFGIAETEVASDGAAATVRFADIEENAQGAVPGTDTTLATLDIRGTGTGTTDIEVTVDRLDDDSGTSLEATTEMGLVIVGPPPATGGDEPTDPDGDGLFEDVNGNGRLDYADIETLFDSFEDDSVRLNKTAYDFNENGQLDYDDIVTLYSEVN